MTLGGPIRFLAFNLSFLIRLSILTYFTFIRPFWFPHSTLSLTNNQGGNIQINTSATVLLGNEIRQFASYVPGIEDAVYNSDLANGRDIGYRLHLIEDAAQRCDLALQRYLTKTIPYIDQALSAARNASLLLQSESSCRCPVPTLAYLTSLVLPTAFKDVKELRARPLRDAVLTTINMYTELQYMGPHSDISYHMLDMLDLHLEGFMTHHFYTLHDDDRADDWTFMGYHLRNVDIQQAVTKHMVNEVIQGLKRSTNNLRSHLDHLQSTIYDLGSRVLEFQASSNNIIPKYAIEEEMFKELARSCNLVREQLPRRGGFQL